MTDYLIVGGGIAGLCFADFCLRNNKTFVLIDSNSRTSSKVAGGMYNPVVLKRFTSIWNSEEQLALAIPFYKQLEQDLETRFLYELPIFRKFASIEEQNNWFHASDQPSLSKFLNDKINLNEISNIPSKFGFGEVFQTGFLDVKQFVISYQQKLVELNVLQYDSFDYKEISFENDFVSYKENPYRNIIFAEGFSMQNNPYFNNLP